ncbi:MAG TPA: AmmeMemoRadiSam system protein A [Casimicrobiaceae bacterium]|nr:AmmeMemoRadiSam system protein A [Casimicrobiaceae bacterium]
MPDRDLGRALLALARGAIGAELGLARHGTAAHPALAEPGATFVTLRKDAELRGCIGSLEPRRALAVDVRANAVAAAFGDPRFPPLAAAEYIRTSVEVSLLSRHVPVAFDDEEHLLLQLRPGVDGVVLHSGHRRATFLPQVWESLPDPREFVAALRQKAGVPASVRTTQLGVARYTVVKWAESEFESEALRT